MGCFHSSKHKKAKIKPKPENVSTFSEDISNHSIYGRSPIVSFRYYKVISHDTLEMYRLSKRNSSGTSISSVNPPRIFPLLPLLPPAPPASCPRHRFWCFLHRINKILQKFVQNPCPVSLHL